MGQMFEPVFYKIVTETGETVEDRLLLTQAEVKLTRYLNNGWDVYLVEDV